MMLKNIKLIIIGTTVLSIPLSVDAMDICLVKDEKEKPARSKKRSIYKSSPMSDGDILGIMSRAPDVPENEVKQISISSANIRDLDIRPVIPTTNPETLQSDHSVKIPQKIALKDSESQNEFPLEKTPPVPAARKNLSKSPTLFVESEKTVPPIPLERKLVANRSIYPRLDNLDPENPDVPERTTSLMKPRNDDPRNLYVANVAIDPSAPKPTASLMEPRHYIPGDFERANVAIDPSAPKPTASLMEPRHYIPGDFERANVAIDPSAPKPTASLMEPRHYIPGDFERANVAIDPSAPKPTASLMEPRHYIPGDFERANVAIDPSAPKPTASLMEPRHYIPGDFERANVAIDPSAPKPTASLMEPRHYIPGDFERANVAIDPSALKPTASLMKPRHYIPGDFDGEREVNSLLNSTTGFKKLTKYLKKINKKLTYEDLRAEFVRRKLFVSTEDIKLRVGNLYSIARQEASKSEPNSVFSMFTKNKTVDDKSSVIISIVNRVEENITDQIKRQIKEQERSEIFMSPDDLLPPVPDRGLKRMDDFLPPVPDRGLKPRQNFSSPVANRVSNPMDDFLPPVPDRRLKTPLATPSNSQHSMGSSNKFTIGRLMENLDSNSTKNCN